VFAIRGILEAFPGAEIFAGAAQRQALFETGVRCIIGESVRA
jgi:hypothetical protein